MADKSHSLADLGLTARGGREVVVTGLAVDSRQVKPGMLFAALPGATSHGAEFIQYALRMGAGAVLTDPLGAQVASGVLSGSQAAVVIVQDPRQALAYAAALWFGGGSVNKTPFFFGRITLGPVNTNARPLR